MATIFVFVLASLFWSAGDFCSEFPSPTRSHYHHLSNLVFHWFYWHLSAHTFWNNIVIPYQCILSSSQNKECKRCETWLSLLSVCRRARRLVSNTIWVSCVTIQEDEGYLKFLYSENNSVNFLSFCNFKKGHTIKGLTIFLLKISNFFFFAKQEITFTADSKSMNFKLYCQYWSKYC